MAVAGAGFMLTEKIESKPAGLRIASASPAATTQRPTAQQLLTGIVGGHRPQHGKHYR
jgi:hypothetical protein